MRRYRFMTLLLVLGAGLCAAGQSASPVLQAMQTELDRFMHLFALNRGVLMIPFHNMALIAPGATEADVDRHTQVFREAVAALAG